METIDWAIQLACASLCAFLLKQWWSDHLRVAVFARYLGIAVVSVGLLLAAAYLGRTSGVIEQYQADSRSVETEWSARAKAIPKVLATDKVSDETDLHAAFDKAAVTMVRTGVVSGRSYASLVGVWMVVLFVATVPAPSGRRSDKSSENHGDDDHG